MPTSQQEKVVVFVGRSGNGITSCVQTIEKINDTGLVVKECPDVGDNDQDLKKDKDEVLQDTANLIQNQNLKYGGIDALVFVLKYGVRFTKQEKDAVSVVKSVFGDSVFRDRGIIAFSCGDLFDLDCGDTPDKAERFMDWCREQKGDVEKLFQEVNYRCVLFDNKSKDVTENKKLVTLLSNHVLYIRLTQPKYQTLNLRRGESTIVAMNLTNQDTDYARKTLFILLHLLGFILNIFAVLARSIEPRINPQIDINYPSSFKKEDDTNDDCNC
ncbi:AIG protein [Biomphalaria glabrata]|nr:AIG protein [Biomphalaria glabrata]